MQTTNTGIGGDLTSFLVVFSKLYFFAFSLYRKEIPLFLPRPLHKEDPDFSLDYYLAHLQQLKEVSELHKRRAGKLMVRAFWSYKFQSIFVQSKWCYLILWV